MDDTGFERYSRHINLDQVGFDGQLALEHSHALLIGAGGLGCPAALYLAAAGVGQITLVDDDHVELSNLQRQIGHHTDAIGQPKAESLQRAALAINPTVAVAAVTGRADADNLPALVSAADIVLDGCDNLSTRQAVNAACAQHNTTLVTGSAVRFEGQIAVLKPGQPGSACYRCLYPDTLGEQENCQSAGVVSPLVGILGSYMALEAIKQLIGLGEASLGRLWLFDALAHHWQPLQITRRDDCPVCGAA